MYDENNNLIRQKIDKNLDGFYVLELDENLCSVCNQFVPYFMDNSGNTVYAQNSGNYLGFNEDNFQNIALKEEGVNLANSTIQISYANTINYYWKNRQDLGTKYVLDSAVLYGYYSDLPISSYMLNKFMYGDGSYDLYDSNHWITRELISTDWYEEKKSIALEEVQNISNGEMKNIFKCKADLEISKYISDLNNNVRRDFAYSFGRVCPYVNIIKSNEGNTYIEIKINDLYDFGATHSGRLLIDALNAWGSYYQEQGLGKVFEWDVYYIKRL